MKKNENHAVHGCMNAVPYREVVMPREAGRRERPSARMRKSGHFSFFALKNVRDDFFRVSLSAATINKIQTGNFTGHPFGAAIHQFIPDSSLMIGAGERYGLHFKVVLQTQGGVCCLPATPKRSASPI